MRALLRDLVEERPLLSVAAGVALGFAFVNLVGAAVGVLAEALDFGTIETHIGDRRIGWGPLIAAAIAFAVVALTAAFVVRARR